MKDKKRTTILNILVIVVLTSIVLIVNSSVNKNIKPTYSAYAAGDIDNSGVIDLTDVGRLYRGMKGIITLTSDEEKAGDVVLDGMIDLSDVARLYRYHMGMINTLVVDNRPEVESLTYINQLGYSNLAFCKNTTIKSSGCGVVSFAMVAKAYSSKYSSYSNDQIVKEARDWFCDMRGWSVDYGIHSSLLYDARTLEHFGLQHEMLFRYTYDGFWSNKMKQDEADKIFNAIKRDGKSVLLAMPGHWAAVGPNPQCKENEVYFYNPSSSSQTKCYTMQGLYNVTYNHKGTCGTAGGMCGWAVAIAYSS